MIKIKLQWIPVDPSISLSVDEQTLKVIKDKLPCDVDDLPSEIREQVVSAISDCLFDNPIELDTP